MYTSKLKATWESSILLLCFYQYKLTKGFMMNFYQRANLTFSLSTLIAFQFPISKFINGDSGFTGELWLLITWMVFQFIFRLKVAVDDHYSFNTPRENKVHLFVDYLLFCFGNVLFVLAAIFSLRLMISGCFFLGGLFVCTCWIYHHYRIRKNNIDNKERKSDLNRYYGWVALNITYALLLALLFGKDFLGEQSFPAQVVLSLLLFGMLVLDFIVSETIKNMPPYDEEAVKLLKQNGYTVSKQ